MRKVTLFSAGLAILCGLAASGEALAKSRHHYRYGSAYLAEGRQPLVVERRSFLDPGTKVPVGYTNRYMAQQTFFNQDPLYANQRRWGGGETLPRRLDVVPYEDGLPFDFP